MVFEGFKPAEKGEDNFAAARALFSSPQELFAKVSADSGSESSLSPMSVSGGSGHSTRQWEGSSPSGQDVAAMSNMNIKAGVDLSTPA
jgi:hypothetical protein